MIEQVKPAEKTFDTIPTRESLLSRLKDWNDDASWKVFFDTYWRLIYNAATRAGLNDAEAQDVVQETVLSVLKAMPKFKYEPERGSFKSWLWQVTKRRIADLQRKRLPGRSFADARKGVPAGRTSAQPWRGWRTPTGLALREFGMKSGKLI